jgi:hypothetical protein
VVLSLPLSISLLGVCVATVFTFLGVWLTTGRLAAMSLLTGCE